MPRWIRMVAVGALVLFGLAACDNGGDFDEAAYCDIARAISDVDDFPSEAQMDEYVEQAPEDVQDDAELAREKILAAEDPNELFSSEDREFMEAIENLEQAEAEHCEIGGDEGGDEEAAAPGAGSDYCNLAEELASQDAPPSPDQLEQYKALAPEEISEQATFVADAFLAAGDDVGAVFSDPAVEEQLGEIEAFEAEHCGIGRDDGGDDEELETEPAEGANVVEIAGVDFAFEGVPDEVASGSTAFAFSNEGESAHEMIVFQLQEGKTAEDVLELEGEDDPAAAEVVAGEVGGTFGTPGSQTTYVNAEVEPGTYALICFIPGPGGESHAELGMRATFTVA